jgi:hypothetical protein
LDATYASIPHIRICINACGTAINSVFTNNHVVTPIYKHTAKFNKGFITGKKFTKPHTHFGFRAVHSIKMSGESLVHITIYLKNNHSQDNTDKYTPSYEVSENNNDQLLFSQHIFPEAFEDWCYDGAHIVDVSPLDMRKRLAALQQSHDVPQCVESKIKGIIKYIEDNLERYIGLTLVF